MYVNATQVFASWMLPFLQIRLLQVPDTKGGFEEDMFMMMVMWVEMTENMTVSLKTPIAAGYKSSSLCICL